jgi:hypothetical protein
MSNGAAMGVKAASEQDCCGTLPKRRAKKAGDATANATIVFERIVQSEATPSCSGTARRTVSAAKSSW